MKWLALAVCVLVFLACVAGVFACAMVGNVDPKTEKREERNARLLFAGAVTSFIAGALILTRW